MSNSAYNRYSKVTQTADTLCQLRRTLGVNNEELLELVLHTLPKFLPSAPDYRTKGGRKVKAAQEAVKAANLAVASVF